MPRNERFSLPIPRILHDRSLRLFSVRIADLFRNYLLIIISKLLLIVNNIDPFHQEVFLQFGLSFVSCCSRHDRKPLLYILSCRIALFAEQFQDTDLLFPDLVNAKRQICHSRVRTCISLCCMRPVHQPSSCRSLPTITLLGLKSPWHTFLCFGIPFKSCQEARIVVVASKSFRLLDLGGPVCLSFLSVML